MRFGQSFYQAGRFAVYKDMHSDLRPTASGLSGSLFAIPQTEGRRSLPSLSLAGGSCNTHGERQGGRFSTLPLPLLQGLNSYG